jgi:transposase
MARLEVIYSSFRQPRRYAPDLAADLGDEPGFRVMPKRWIGERAFSWLGRQGRLSKRYGRLTGSAEAVISLVGSRLLLARQGCSVLSLYAVTVQVEPR